MAENNVMTKFSREASLLIIGAAISCISSLVTTLTFKYFEHQQDIRAKKFSVLSDLSVDLGQRLH